MARARVCRVASVDRTGVPHAAPLCHAFDPARRFGRLAATDPNSSNSTMPDTDHVYETAFHEVVNVFGFVVEESGIARGGGSNLPQAVADGGEFLAREHLRNHERFRVRGAGLEFFRQQSPVEGQ